MQYFTFEHKAKLPFYLEMEYENSAVVSWHA